MNGIHFEEVNFDIMSAFNNYLSLQVRDLKTPYKMRIFGENGKRQTLNMFNQSSKPYCKCFSFPVLVSE